MDGSNLDLAELIRTEIIQPGILETYTAGHLGCALSHLALWNKAIAIGAPLTICEDDAILHLDFELRAAQLLALLPADWDIILWGWNFDAPLDIDFLSGVSPCLVLCDQSALRAGISRFQQLPISPQPFPVRQAFGLPCYSVSPKGAQALREFSLPIRPMRLRFAGGDDYVLNVGIDCMMAGLYPGIRAFVSFPPLAVTMNQRERQETPLAAR